MRRILIAGIGNIFLGDDAFGVEVAAELSRRSLPPEALVVDFGIRSYDLAFALGDGYEAAILVDAAPRGEAPGTVSLIEPDLAHLARLESAAVDAHVMNPASVLRLAESLGGRPRRLYLVACEPADLGPEDGRLGLSDAARAAVPKAVLMIESLIAKLLRGEQPEECVNVSLDNQTRTGLEPA